MIQTLLRALDAVNRRIESGSDPEGATEQRRQTHRKKSYKKLRKFHGFPMTWVSQDIGYRRPKNTPEGSAMN
jgi:hypothetical protein